MFKLEHKTKTGLYITEIYLTVHNTDDMTSWSTWPIDLSITQTGGVTHTTMGPHRHCSSWPPRVWTTDLFPVWHFLRNHYHDIYSWNTEYFILTLVIADIQTFEKMKYVMLLSFHLKKWDCFINTQQFLLNILVIIWKMSKFCCTNKYFPDLIKFPQKLQSFSFMNMYIIWWNCFICATIN